MIRPASGRFVWSVSDIFRNSNRIAPLILSLSVTRESEVDVVYGVSLLLRQNRESFGLYPFTGLIAGSMNTHSLSETTSFTNELSISLYSVSLCSLLFRSRVLIYIAFGSDTSMLAGVPELLPRLNAPDPEFSSIGNCWSDPNKLLVLLRMTDGATLLLLTQEVPSETHGSCGAIDAVIFIQLLSDLAYVSPSNGAS